MSKFTYEDAKIGYGLIIAGSVFFGLWQRDIFSGLFLFCLLSAIIFIADNFKNGE